MSLCSAAPGRLSQAPSPAGASCGATACSAWGRGGTRSCRSPNNSGTARASQSARDSAAGPGDRAVDGSASEGCCCCSRTAMLSVSSSRMWCDGRCGLPRCGGPPPPTLLPQACAEPGVHTQDGRPPCGGDSSARCRGSSGRGVRGDCCGEDAPGRSAEPPAGTESGGSCPAGCWRGSDGIRRRRAAALCGDAEGHLTVVT
mmetsp:Transcript_44613/g.133185  ORF Transcript_44613/g.133185 Transcript_44613/m.133185 type:complete len:201 (-) Transcript_44613:496-1098(-)